MIQKIFTIYDEKARAYITPFFLPEAGMAIRTFADCVNSDSHQFGKHPSDYTLFTLGGWDDTDGKFNPLLSVQSLGNGVEFIRRTTPQIQEQVEEYLHGQDSKKPDTQIGNVAPVQPSSSGGNSQE